MNQEKEKKYTTYLSPQIRYDDSLIAKSKILFSEILHFSNQNNGYCPFDIKLFQEKLGVSQSNIRFLIRDLVREHYITIEKDEKTGEKVIFVTEKGK